MSSNQDYISSLKQIKELEEKVQQEIDTRKIAVETEVKNLQEEMNDIIANIKQDGEKNLEERIQEARDKATNDAGKILSDAENKTKSLTVPSDQQTMKQIIEILLSGI